MNANLIERMTETARNYGVSSALTLVLQKRYADLKTEEARNSVAGRELRDAAIVAYMGEQAAEREFKHAVARLALDDLRR